MTKKEIIDKVYDDYLRDYENWGSGGTNMDSVEKACKSKFEKNGIEYSLYDIKRELENKSDYNIVNAYVKEYTDTKEDINYSDIEGFIVQYNQGTSLGQLLQDVDLRQYNLQIPDKIIDEISDAVNYIRGYMGRE